MSTEQKEQLAWVTRVITLLLLAIATGVGASVYTKVDEIYTEFKVQREQIMNIKEQLADRKKDDEKMDLQLRTQQRTIESLSRFIREDDLTETP